MSRVSKYSAFVRVEGSVSRERLLERMLHSLPEMARVTILVAPAGFGKTTLLAQLSRRLVHDGVRTIWLNCDREDREPNAFLKSLARAYGAATGTEKYEIADILAGSDASRDRPIAFFIDEYDVASSSATDLLLESIARSLGLQVRLYVGCREMPSVDLTGLQLQGVVRMVDATELKFNETETRALFSDQLDDAALVRVLDMTDGWAVVLQLIRLSLPGPEWPGQTERVLPAGKVFSYVARQVWDRVPEDLREFMAATLPLRDIDAASANWLRGRSDSAQCIARLRELHPIVSVDQQALEARLHPLLREFLTHQLACVNSSVLPGLYARAAEYFESKGATFEAVTHALQSDDPALAARIIERAGAFRLGVSEGMWFVKSLLSLLPDDMIHAHPRLYIMEICSQIVEDNAIENRALLDSIEADMVAANAADDSNPAWIDLRYARCVEMLGLGERAIVWTPWETLNVIKEDAVARITQDPRLLGVVLIVELLLVQRYDDAIKSEVRTDALGRLNQRFRLVANNVWHPIYEAQNDFQAGRLADAEHRLRGLLTKEFDLFRVQQSAFGQITYSLLGRVHFARGDLEEAQACFERIPDDEISPFLEVAEGAIVCRAFGETAAGRPDRALERLQRDLVRAIDQQRPACACLINATRVELLCRTGATEQASLLYAVLVDELKSAGLSGWSNVPDTPWCIILAVARARFYIAAVTDDAHGALAVATDLQRQARLQRRAIAETLAGVLMSEATFLLGKPREAAELLAETLAQCSVPPPAQCFLEHGIHVAPMIGTIAAHGGRATNAAVVVVRIWEREFSANVVALGMLSRRECEVLIQLSRGYATKQIARELALSPETIKFHLKAIFAKLGVNSREDAVHEAHRRVRRHQSGGVSRFADRTDDVPAV